MYVAHDLAALTADVDDDARDDVVVVVAFIVAPFALVAGAAGADVDATC